MPDRFKSSKHNGKVAIRLRSLSESRLYHLSHKIQQRGERADLKFVAGRDGLAVCRNLKSAESRYFTGDFWESHWNRHVIGLRDLSEVIARSRFADNE